VNLHVFP